MLALVDVLRAAATQDAPAIGHDTLQDAAWRRWTAAGHDALARDEHAEAMECYRRSLEEAETIFAAAMAGGTPFLAPMTYNIACINMANALVRTGNRRGGRDWLLQAAGRLVAAAGSASTPIALRINCLRHCAYPLAVLERDLPEQGDAADLAPLLARRREAATLVSRVVGCLPLMRENCDRTAPPVRGEAN